MAEKLPKIAVFIDAGNLWEVHKKLGKLLDLKKLPSFMATKFSGEIYNVFYYVAYPKDGTRDQERIDGQHKFFTFLKKGLGFTIVKKQLKTIYIRNKEGELIYDQDSGEAQSMEKGNLDVELTIDALEYSDMYDIGIFITGDSDFLPLITHLRNNKGDKKAYVFSTEGCISHELKTGADGYFDLAKCPEVHGNPLRRRVE